jgi:hypothetical protein
MSKRNHVEQQSASSRTTLIVMAIGGLLVMGLVGWALTRSIAPQPAATPTASFPSSTQPNDITGGSSATSGTSAADLGQRSDEEAAKAQMGRVTPEQLKPMVDSGNVTVIDVRDAASFASSHIPGSLHIPLARIEGEIQYLPKGKPIVAYCT